MYTGETTRAVGLFSNRRDAEAALHRLRDIGFNMDKVSVVTRHENDGNIAEANVEQTTGDQVKGGASAGAVAGTTAGGLIGLVGSLGVLAIPGVGPVAELGLILANTLIGGGIGAVGGGLVGALIGWGLPEDKAQYYNSRVHEHGDYLVLMEGTDQEIRNAEALLNDYKVRDLHLFGIPGTVGDRRVNPTYNRSF
ncbi:general stress protein [Lyngbya sp. PCC 8106]|uniref:general stress protein n=1 Tax=Lyngbya sp. (strain PCC 8106) TaxID=313612 RepID=UPI0000EAA594|nr:general stress protein [Lyngbya sp. PCC 8106]EAW35317.1 hypothetical protein L8106_20575 [Lyngbya sp. PCC 8106]